ncbi:MAG: DUF3024 domain-containing protein [Ignavibacteria bacterium]|nr:DUF3024 domain-containing protein [Ignavibacteria bacterium]
MIDPLQTLMVIEALENFLERKRPPVHIRDQVDIGYRIDNQSIVIYEVRPKWSNPSEIHESPFAKATYVKAKDLWKIFWMRADLKWHSYQPVPAVKSIRDFLTVVEEDPQGCFWG